MKKSNIGTKILRFIWTIFPWLIILLIIAGIFNLIGKINEKKVRIAEAREAAIKEEIPAIRVITLELRSSNLEDVINLPAEVEPFKDLWVKGEVPGQVVKVFVKEDQYVKEGQVLVELDDRDYLSRIERIEANYELAVVDRDRLARLVKKRIAASTDLDKIEAGLKGLTAQFKEAKLALSRTKITAPISGRINEIKAEKGEWIGVDKPAVQILQMDRVKVVVGIPESDVDAVFNLKQAEVTIDALDKRMVVGKKLFLSRKPRTLARLYDLELVVPNPDNRILPGMFVRVALIKKVYPDALTVPLYSIITENEERFVFVEKNEKVEKRLVELGVLMGWQVHIVSGLKPGEKVVIVGHRLLDDGQDVKVIKNVSDPAEIMEL